MKKLIALSLIVVSVLIVVPAKAATSNILRVINNGNSSTSFTLEYVDTSPFGHDWRLFMVEVAEVDPNDDIPEAELKFNRGQSTKRFFRREVMRIAGLKPDKKYCARANAVLKEDYLLYRQYKDQFLSTENQTDTVCFSTGDKSTQTLNREDLNTLRFVTYTYDPLINRVSIEKRPMVEGNSNYNMLTWEVRNGGTQNIDEPVYVTVECAITTERRKDYTMTQMIEEIMPPNTVLQGKFALDRTTLVKGCDGNFSVRIETKSGKDQVPENNRQYVSISQ